MITECALTCQPQMGIAGPECSFLFTDIGLLRRHMKREQLNKWSPWHKYISANIMNIEIPEETSLFTELKTLTENDSERSVRGLRRLQWTTAEAS